MAGAVSRRKKATKPRAKKGTHGGKRAGAGAKQSRLPKDLLDDLGEPPEDPLHKSAWWNRMLEVLQYGVLKGEPWTQMLRDAQRTALVQSKLIPEQIKARAAQLLEADERETNEDVSPSTVKRQEDPIARSNAGALRRNSS